MLTCSKASARLGQTTLRSWRDIPSSSNAAPSCSSCSKGQTKRGTWPPWKPGSTWEGGQADPKGIRSPAGRLECALTHSTSAKLWSGDIIPCQSLKTSFQSCLKREYLPKLTLRMGSSRFNWMTLRVSWLLSRQHGEGTDGCACRMGSAQPLNVSSRS